MQRQIPPNDDKIDGRQLMAEYVEFMRAREIDTVQNGVKELRATAIEVRSAHLFTLDGFSKS